MSAADAPRRAFLQGLVALPAAADITIGLAAAAAGDEAGSQPVTFDQLAAADYQGCDVVNIDAVRQAFESHWAIISLAASAMFKNADEMAVAAGKLLEHGDALLPRLQKDMRASAEWMRQTAQIIESAEVRLVAGACRHAKSHGLTASAVGCDLRNGGADV